MGMNLTRHLGVYWDKTPSGSRTHYHRIGEEEGLLKLVTAFYRIMDHDPEVVELRDMHGENLARMGDMLFRFLSGWLGGPALYERQNGPALEVAHRHLTIGPDERDQWLYCMNRAMDETVADDDLRVELAEGFFRAANSITKP